MQNISLNRVSIMPLILLIGMTALLTACEKRATAYIFILDLTESVSPQSREKSFEAIKIRAKHLKRGDSITVIPINADAQTETSGNVLHLNKSEKRNSPMPIWKSFL